MRKYLVLLWLLLPLPMVVLHFGKGQQWLAQDHAHDLIVAAQAAEQKNDWHVADNLYQQAAEVASSANDAKLRLRLELARTRSRFHLGDAMTAITMAEKLIENPQFNAMPGEFQNEVRELGARIHYYAAWVMRLEGARRELWMEEAELSRQNFRMLAEQSATPVNAGEQEIHQKNLESAIQLQRLSMTELMARPLPKEGQGMGGQGLSEQMSERRGGRGKNGRPGNGENGEGDPASGAGASRYQPGAGS